MAEIIFKFQIIFGKFKFFLAFGDIAKETLEI